ncbi:NAD(P)H-binding protein [Nonomuraea sp. NPDC050556]|uniref:NAD(P)H-binding protein n=1 Tax=Nonomuraea sp. NPDC050556 TaxID=3364369 RepID=UPI0037AFEDC5
MENNTLILGGKGKTGRRVADRLQGMPVRIASRSAQIPFDWENPDTWEAAVEGIQQVYITYQPDLAVPGAADSIRAFVDVAVRSGVRRLVLLSGRREEQAQLSEQIVKDSGLEWTIVTSSFFAQNFSEGVMLPAVLGGAIALPAGMVAEPFIDIDDIADIVAEALSTDKHVGKHYEVTGPRLLTFADAAAEIAEVSGREVAYYPMTPDEYRAEMAKYGVPEEETEMLIALFGEILDGRNALVADGVQQALGRPARDFSDYARDAAAAWK